jgi:hypothetical protein
MTADIVLPALPEFECNLSTHQRAYLASWAKQVQQEAIEAYTQQSVPQPEPKLQETAEPFNVDAWISIWSARPQPKTPTGDAWEAGARAATNAYTCHLYNGGAAAEQEKAIIDAIYAAGYTLMRVANGKYQLQKLGKIEVQSIPDARPGCKPGGCLAIGCEGGIYCFDALGNRKPPNALTQSMLMSWVCQQKIGKPHPLEAFVDAYTRLAELKKVNDHPPMVAISYVIQDIEQNMIPVTMARPKPK